MLAGKCNLWQVDRSVVVVMSNHELRVCLAYICIHHRHRVYVVLRIFYVLVLDQIEYYNDYSTLWHHLVLCVNHKMAMMENGLYYKTSSHLCAQNQYPPKHDIPFMSKFFTCPFFVFALINYSMFVCCIRQVFLKFYYQTNIRCTGSSFHNHFYVMNFCTRQLHSWN